ncbi:hypothetical protein Nepgr_002948 [Nepenthes gracilis]|uniref:Uncharacterized protein n=1 Tax=Nepenthes gracilis TaxID=150966 RepID=A0AAD3P793_NEPGR|nr:hypothetical protein Nepgr_002948 [Nepenthes gracilis]
MVMLSAAAVAPILNLDDGFFDTLPRLRESRILSRYDLRWLGSTSPSPNHVSNLLSSCSPSINKPFLLAASQNSFSSVCSKDIYLSFT